MAVSKVMYPSGTTAGDLDFDSLLAFFDGKDVYFGAGKYTKEEADAICATKEALAAELSANLELAGELDEKGWKAESKPATFKTRNFLLEGRRTTTMEITLAGMSNRQKSYFEKDIKQKTLTFVFVDDGSENALLITGCKWICEWSGEADKGFTVVLKTEFAGTTDDKVMVYKGIPAA